MKLKKHIKPSFDEEGFKVSLNDATAQMQAMGLELPLQTLYLSHFTNHPMRPDNHRPHRNKYKARHMAEAA